MSASLLGPLAPLLDDPSITDIMVNGGRQVWIERAGSLERVPLTLAHGQIEHIVERILAPLGIRIDAVSPVADARLPDGSRLHVMAPPISLDGMAVSLRRFRAIPLTLDSFAPPDVTRYLTDAVARRANILVSGATSAGKTTLLNALAGCFERNERIVTIEDAAELRLPGVHVVRLETRSSSADGLGAITIRDLVRAALRMRPDRIVVGEVRGAEALDMLQALNTGHDGSLTTCHANGALDALRRIDTMALLAASGLPLAAVEQQVQRAIDIVVHVARGRHGHRVVHDIGEVMDGSERIRSVANSDGLLPGSRPTWIGRQP